MTASTTPDRVLAAVAAHPGVTATDLAAATGLGRSTVTKALAGLEQTGQVIRTPGGRENGRKRPDRWSPPAVDTGSGFDRPKSGGKLGRGELRALVLSYLRERPGEEHGPTAIGKALGRSSGAVGNALVKLVGDGDVIETGAKPRRYTVLS